MNVIGLCGFIGSGKNTVGDILVNDYGYEKLSFAGTLKDITSILFSWDRNLLEGDTPDGREFREKKDEYWSNILGYYVTPRNMLQKMGTEVMRNNVHNDIWVNSLKKKLLDNRNKKFVITDVRFQNEIDFLRDKSIGAKIIQIFRGTKPEWYDDAKSELSGKEKGIMAEKWPNVHRSEWDWINSKLDYYLINETTLDELKVNVELMLKVTNPGESSRLIDLAGIPFDEKWVKFPFPLNIDN